MTDTATVTTDPRPLFQDALTTAADTVAAVRPDQLGDPTPCSEFDVRALIGHLLEVVDRVTAVGCGGDPFAVTPRPVENAWVDLWVDAEASFQMVWGDDAALAQPSPLPWAPGVGADVLRSYCSELTVHTWDMATATSQRPAWDDEVLRTVAAGLNGLPAEGRAELFASIKASLPSHLAAGPDPFADAVPVADDAPLIDRIVAWNGRQP